MIAHRGFASIYPENTLSAVNGAAADGASLIEVDVRRCGSGEVVVLHDETVDRVTDASGSVREYSVAELAGMNVCGSGEGIPTLEALATALPPGIGLNVELKERGIAGDALSAVSSVESVLVSSFDQQALREAKTAAPDRPRALIVDKRSRTAVRRARAADCVAVHPKATLLLRSRLVKRAHGAGMAVNAWTLRSPRLTKLLVHLGVDGIIADTPDVLPRS